MNTVFGNIPWLGAFLLLIMYIIFLVSYAAIQGRKKYVYISLVMMILAMVFELFTITSIYITAAFAAIYFIILFFVMATRSQ